MKPVDLVFCVMAFMISCMRDRFIEMQVYCYKLSALFLCVSSLFTFVSVSWNYKVGLYGQNTLDFPPDFRVKKEVMISKHFAAIFTLGFLTPTMSLFGVTMFLAEERSFKLQSHVKAQSA
ncbi:hypothetical protein H671_xg20431 [Cricetulus griseus]|uniref:Uncharacterized protein n=1 Tax=Cricetulus griseus TaxID=10029 RepID=A0A061I030_CRIGR|nr:hypothetical protein H671_xg20431 [Cricetulus griseus]